MTSHFGCGASVLQAALTANQCY